MNSVKGGGGGGGGGRGGHPALFVKLDFAKQLTNKLRPMTKLLRGFRVPTGQARPYLLNFAKSP